MSENMEGLSRAINNTKGFYDEEDEEVLYRYIVEYNLCDDLVVMLKLIYWLSFIFVDALAMI